MPFLNPLFLFALAAAAIPIALHLLNRRNPKPVAFSTLRFIEAAVAKTRKSRHLTQVLILALRMLIILLLVLAFARPRLRSAGWLPEGARTLVIVLDASASMRCRDLDVTRFDQARTWAQELLATLDEEDRVALVLAGAPPGREQVIFPPITNHGLIQKALREAVCGYGRVDMVASLGDLLADLDERGVAGSVEIHCFSDFQASAWPEEAAAELGEQLGVRDARLFANRVWAPTGNAWIEQVTIAPEAILGAGEVRAGGVVMAGPHYTGAGTLRLVLQDREVAQTGLPLTPGGGIPFSLEGVVEGGGDVARGHLQLDDDALAADNRHVFALARQEHVQVLIVDGTEPAVAFQRDGFYLARALNPRGLANPLIRSENVAWSELLARDLGSYQAVLIANPRAITAAVALKLEAYASRGGTVVLYPGDAGGLVSGYEQLKPLAPLTLQEERFPVSRQWRIIGSEAPARLERQLRESMRRLPVISGTRRLIIGIDDSAGAVDRALMLDDGRPLAVRVAHDDGAFWVAALSANRAWSEWPLSPLYVIMHQLLIRESFARQQLTRRVVVGELAEIPWAGPEKRLTGTLSEPGGRRRNIALERPTAAAPFVLDELFTPGIYQLDLSEVAAAPRYVAVNVAPAESRLAEVNDAALAASLGSAQLYQSRDWAEHRRFMAGMTYGQPLWPWLLLLAFLLGIAEELVANVRSWGQAAPESLQRLLRLRRT